ncbi:MAG: histidine kinase dimerization/phospho-acceptor domain-containing protein, partial [Terriglobia bacterium]
MLLLTVAQYTFVTFPQWQGSIDLFSTVLQRSLFISVFFVFSILLTHRIVTATKLLEQSKEHVAAIVSHELRTPLTSIIGYISLVLAGKTGSVSERQKHFLEPALEQAKMLEKLVEDFQSLAGPEHFLEAESDTYDLVELVNEV